MAVAVQSVSTTTFAGGSSVVITAPSGIAVDDLLIARITIDNGGGSTTPSGWTLERLTSNPATFASYIYYKIADGSDAAASSFTFSVSNVGSSSGTMLRVTGHSFGKPIWTSNGTDTDDSASPSFAAAITPSIASSLLIMFFFGRNTSTGTFSTYAIATSDPGGWSEHAEYSASGVGYAAAIASATRTQTTSTGNFSVVFTGNSTSDWVGQILAIQPGKDVDISDSTTTSDSVNGSITMSISDSFSVSDAVSALKSMWTNAVKTATTWVNQDRHE